MEVAQICRGIVYQLRAVHRLDDSITKALPDIELIETVGFGHDLGHPPFGHSGEIALNYMMRNNGGFEGNGQSLRILSRLEPHTLGYGLDLSRRTLLGILKYPSPYSAVRSLTQPPDVAQISQLSRDQWKPPKCYLDTEQDVVDWILAPLSSDDRQLFTKIDPPPSDAKHGKTRFKALDTSIMELADDIAYGIHDFEDGVTLNLITSDHWKEALAKLDKSWAELFELNTTEIGTALFAPRRGKRSGRRKQVIGALVNAMVCSVDVKKHSDFQSSLLAYSAELKEPARKFLDALTDITWNYVIKLQSVQTLEYRGRFVVMNLYDALESDWKSLLGTAYRKQAEETGDIKRSVCDYIAGMTDTYAVRMYERLFVPRQGSIFERI
jgi:dGTPase